jgi:hypothetical protein
MLTPQAGILSLCSDMMNGQGLLKDHRKGQGGSQHLASPFSERTVNFNYTKRFITHLHKD